MLFAHGDYTVLILFGLLVYAAIAGVCLLCIYFTFRIASKCDWSRRNLYYGLLLGMLLGIYRRGIGWYSLFESILPSVALGGLAVCLFNWVASKSKRDKIPSA